MQTLDPLAVLVILIIVFASVVWFILPFVRSRRENRHLSKSNGKSDEVSLISPSQRKFPRKSNKRFAIFSPIKRWSLETKRTIATKLGICEASPTENRVPSRESIDAPTVDESRKESSFPSHAAGSNLSPDDVPVLQPVLYQLSPEDIAIADELWSYRKESKEELSELLQEQKLSQDNFEKVTGRHVSDDKSPEEFLITLPAQDESEAEKPLPTPTLGESSRGDATTRPGYGNKSTIVDEIEISNIATARYYKFVREASLTSFTQQNDSFREVSLAPTEEQESPRESNTRSSIVNYIREQILSNKSAIAHKLGISEEHLARECVGLFPGEKLSQDQNETVNDGKLTTEKKDCGQALSADTSPPV
jgi:hypothetical protein